MVNTVRYHKLFDTIKPGRSYYTVHYHELFDYNGVEFVLYNRPGLI